MGMEVGLSAYGVVIFIISYVLAKLTSLMGLLASFHVVGLSLYKNTLVSCPLVHDSIRIN